MTRIIGLCLVIICLLACEKAKIDKEPELLSEIIYGDWETRARISPLDYGDEEYHDLDPPYLEKFSFFEDNTFNRYFNGNLKSTSPAPFELSDVDSTLVLNRGTPYRVYFFNQDTIDLRCYNREGQVGKMLIRLE